MQRSSLMGQKASQPYVPLSGVDAEQVCSVYGSTPVTLQTPDVLLLPPQEDKYYRCSRRKQIPVKEICLGIFLLLTGVTFILLAYLHWKGHIKQQHGAVSHGQTNKEIDANAHAAC